MKAQNESTFIKSIEKYGEKYVEKNLQHYSKEKLLTDWWYALEFFWGRSFMRGRRDKLSNEYKQFAVDTLKNEFKIDQISREDSYKIMIKNKLYFDKSIMIQFRDKYDIGKKNMIKHSNFMSEVSITNPIIEKLTIKENIMIKMNDEEYIKEVCLGNQEDIMMVLDVLKIVSIHHNIYEYILNIVKNHGVKTAYDQLIKIRGIADKIASFILRDILLINQLKTEYVSLAFPVDTWVKQIAKKIGCVGSLSNVKKCLIKKCQKPDSNPQLFAAGLWYIGFNSLDILLDDFFNI